MAKTGSINEILTKSVNRIAKGRKYWHTIGKEAKGLKMFNSGIARALEAFKDAKATNDIATIIGAEYVFAAQDFSSRNKNNPYAKDSLMQGVYDMKDCLLLLSATSAELKGSDKFISSKKDDRIGGYPKDAFHKCCASQKVRLQNSLKSNIPSDTERGLAEQRIDNLAHAQELHKQKQASLMPKRSRDKELGD